MLCVAQRRGKRISIVWWNYRSAGEFLKLVKLHSNLVTWPPLQRSVPESTAEVLDPCPPSVTHSQEPCP